MGLSPFEELIVPEKGYRQGITREIFRWNTVVKLMLKNHCLDYRQVQLMLNGYANQKIAWRIVSTSGRSAGPIPT